MSRILLSFVFLFSFSAESLFVESSSSEWKKADYQLGDHWNRFPLTEENGEDEVLQKVSSAVVSVNSSTGIYLGKFGDKHLVATNHHVCSTGYNCAWYGARFQVLKKVFYLKSFLGSWPEIDLGIFSIDVPAHREVELQGIGRNFAFHEELSSGQPLLSLGFGIVENEDRVLTFEKSSDCKILSSDQTFKLLSDPDELHPVEYKAWSFALGCDASHGDSGSPIFDPFTGSLLGIFWTGSYPKHEEVQNSQTLEEWRQNSNPATWTKVNYAVPASKIFEVLKAKLENNEVRPEARTSLKALLGLP